MQQAQMPEPVVPPGTPWPLPTPPLHDPDDAPGDMPPPPMDDPEPDEAPPLKVSRYFARGSGPFVHPIE